MDSLTPESTPVPPSLASARKRLLGLKLLVVDDNEDARELVTQVLECAGAGVTQADSVADAIAALRVERFALLLSDISMPEADGYELMRHVRASDLASLRETPAIAMTAFCGAADRMRATAAGFQEHVSKPFDPVRLVELVRRLARTR